MKPDERTMVQIPIREVGVYPDPTLEEMLSDPIITAVMRADAVDPRGLAAMMRAVGRTLRAARPVERVPA
jgi:hypothetical protein